MAAVTVLENEVELAEAVADRVTALAGYAVEAFRGVTICLTGGYTPARLYRLLADPARPWRGRIEWPLVHLFWSDERHVAPDHPDSNYGMATRALVEHVPVPAEQVHRMRGELPDARAAALEYEAALRDGFVRARRRDRRFDLLLLGLGEDAHIASIFPGSPLLGSEPNPAMGSDPNPVTGSDPNPVLGSDPNRVAAVWAPHLDAWRITLTPPALLDARAIVLLVSGATKADAVHAALERPTDAGRWPAHLLRDAGGRVEWFIDRAAAARLST